MHTNGIYACFVPIQLLVFIDFFFLDRKTFSSVIDDGGWICKVRREDDSLPIVLVANKSDLPESILRVPVEEIKDAAKKYNLLNFYIVSAKTATNVSDVFEGILEFLSETQGNRSKKERTIQLDATSSTITKSSRCGCR